jgi:protoporphyrin/coproporphyrin ferrochelatase
VSATGVLVLSHGTPASHDEIEPFYTRIRHGHPPSAELLDDLVQRYDAIGGLSPLAARTDAQVRGLAAELERRAPNSFVVAGATKYASPAIEEGVEALVSAAPPTVIGLILSPLNAPSSTDAYHERAARAIGDRTEYRPVWSWWDAPGFAQLAARRVRDQLDLASSRPLVAFTAHSLPARVAGAEEYAAELGLLAASVAAAAGVDDYVVCWQSAGRTSDVWLGPGLLEVLASLDPTEVPEVVVAPVGFVSDHLEVLYDVDLEAQRAAGSRGITLRRTRSLNDDEDFLSMLATVVQSVAGDP